MHASQYLPVEHSLMCHYCIKKYFINFYCDYINKNFECINEWSVSDERRTQPPQTVIQRKCVQKKRYPGSQSNYSRRPITCKIKVLVNRESRPRKELPVSNKVTTEASSISWTKVAHKHSFRESIFRKDLQKFLLQKKKGLHVAYVVHIYIYIYGTKL